MKPEIATNPLQSARLKACGIDPKSADFVWMEGKPNPRLTLRTEIIEDSNPYIVAYGWSLSALLTLLPKVVYHDGDMYYLDLAQCFPLTDEYAATYKPAWFEGDDLFLARDNSPIEACVQLIERLVENGYKLNEVKQ